jgi:hypothetical protein
MTEVDMQAVRDRLDREEELLREERQVLRRDHKHQAALIDCLALSERVGRLGLTPCAHRPRPPPPTSWYSGPSVLASSTTVPRTQAASPPTSGSVIPTCRPHLSPPHSRSWWKPRIWDG